MDAYIRDFLLGLKAVGQGRESRKQTIALRGHSEFLVESILLPPTSSFLSTTSKSIVDLRP